MFLRHEFQSKEVAVSLDLAPALPPVLGDLIQLQQVVVNLGINAVQAMAHAATGRRQLAIRTMLTGRNTLCCTLEDSGPGIKSDHLTQLFERFFHDQRRWHGDGTSHFPINHRSTWRTNPGGQRVCLRRRALQLHAACSNRPGRLGQRRGRSPRGAGQAMGKSTGPAQLMRRARPGPTTPPAMRVMARREGQRRHQQSWASPR